MIKLTKRLGDILLEMGVITKEQLGIALTEQKTTGERLGKTLVRLGFLQEADIARALESQLFIPFLDISAYPVEHELVNMLPKELVENERVIPIKKIGQRLQVAIVDPLNPVVLDTIRRITNCEIDPVITTETCVRKVLEKIHAAKFSAEKALDDLKEEITKRADERTSVAAVEVVSLGDAAKETAHAIVRLVDSILNQALMSRASDIHVEPQEKQVRVRYRVDGVLYQLMTLPKEVHNDVVTRFKVISGMDVAEHRLPQDGHIVLRTQEGKEYHLRSATLTGYYGETVVIRVLDKESPLIGLEKINFSGHNLEVVKRLIRRPYGIILVCGPTGSGKTTSLYSILNELNKETRKIVTIEDPIEYQFDTITQTQVNPKIDYTFASGLRAILRQDPDIVMVGEIRDQETLQIAIQASLTGHLVLSTLHTNDSVSAVTRMQDMGVGTNFILAGVIGVLAQRLVRRLCPTCREPVQVKGDDLHGEGFRVEYGQTLTVYQARGCSKCNFRGYNGRMAIHEVLTFDPEVSEMFSKGEPVLAIRAFLSVRGASFLRDDGLAKVLAGDTSLEELLRVV